MIPSIPRDAAAQRRRCRLCLDTPDITLLTVLSILDSYVDTLAVSLKEVLLPIAEEVLGKQGKKIRVGSQTRFSTCATRDDSRDNKITILRQAWSTERLTEESGRRWKQPRKSRLSNNATTKRPE